MSTSSCTCCCLWRGFKTCWSRNCPCFDCFTGDCSGVCMIIICFLTLGVSLTVIGIFVILKGYVIDDDEFVQVVGLVELSLGLLFCMMSCLGTLAFSYSRSNASIIKQPLQLDNNHGDQPSSSDYPTDIPLQIIQNGVTPTGTVPSDLDQEGCLEEVPPTPPLMGDSPLDLYVHSGPQSEFGSSSNSGMDNDPPIVMVKSRDNNVDVSDNGGHHTQKTFQLYDDYQDEETIHRLSTDNLKSKSKSLRSEVSLVDAEDDELI